MRNFAILTVGFALAILGPGGPSVALAAHFTPVIYDQADNPPPNACKTDNTNDTVDIDRLVVVVTPATDTITVTMELCDDPTDRAKYQVYFEFDDRTFTGGVQDPGATGIGQIDPFYYDEFDCTEENRTFDASGKVRLRFHKKKERFDELVSGPAVGVVHLKMAEVPAMIIFTASYGGLGFSTNDNIFVWGRTQKKDTKPKNIDFAPDIDSGDGCVQPEFPSETLEVVLH